MSAVILSFPMEIAEKVSRRHAGAVFTQAWAEQHLPLIDAAMDLHIASDRQFKQRCREILHTEGSSVLEQLTTQLDRLGAHFAAAGACSTPTAPA